MAKINNLKVGQRIRTTIEGTVISIPGGDSSYVAIDGGPDPKFLGRVTISRKIDADFEILPDPIKVGDVVNSPIGKGIVKAIDEDYAFIKITPKLNGFKEFITEKLTSLKKVCDC